MGSARRKETRRDQQTAPPEAILPFPGKQAAPDEMWREALDMWLRWHEQYDTLSVAMFRAGQKPDKLASLAERMDQLDQLRWRAVDLSRWVLARRKAG